MRTRLLRLTLLAAVALAVSGLAGPLSTQSRADEPAAPPAPAPAKSVKVAPAPLPEGGVVVAPAPYNYYVHPGEAGLVGAQLYVEPRPTPPLVGHTFVTYPPLMPHEFLYQHHRVYHTYNPGSGWTRTRVCWH